MKPKMSPFHIRNRHQGRYDFESLTKVSNELKKFISKNEYGEHTIDFSDSQAVQSLNRALLKKYYGLSDWKIPEGYLCPPIPGRADYIHSVADLLAESNRSVVPRGDSVSALDIGVGANCIYPIIGHCEYGWSFVGSDIDPVAIDSAEKILHQNSSTLQNIEIRLQNSRDHIFERVIQPSDRFELTICNPPFHASFNEAQNANRRKRINLGLKSKTHLNFGGQNNELWCEGGELDFIRRMITESALYSKNVHWFTTLVSKESNLKRIHEALKAIKAKSLREIQMSQGQKKSRIVAWTFRA